MQGHWVPPASIPGSALSPATQTGDGPAQLLPSASGGSAGSATTALLSAFRADFESWASKMETSLHVQFNALKQQVSALEATVSALATTQEDHAAHIVALESVSTAHLYVCGNTSSV